MTEIEQKALALVNDVFAEMGGSPIDCDALVGAGDVVTLALCRAIEQHEAFRQEVSDAVVDYFGPKHLDVILAGHLLSRFIIPAPKPDPLIEVLRSVGGDDRDYCDYDIYVKEIRAALEARGLEIREKAQ
jgi:hypothetical protein